MSHKINRRDFLRGSMTLSSGFALAQFLPFIEYRRAHAQDQPLKAAMSTRAGTAERPGRRGCTLDGWPARVEITWFDGEFDPQAQRAKFDQLSTQGGISSPCSPTRSAR